VRILRASRGFGVFGVIVVLVEGQNHVFDYVLYPAAILWLGPLLGGVIMTALALVLNYIIVVFYNRTRRDWFGLEWLKLQEMRESVSLGGVIFRWMLRLGKIPMFIAVSIYDPAYGFILLRGRNSTGLTLTRVDWSWFLVSNLIGNLAWILVVTGAIEFVRFIF
jgi:hypothetical protein